MILYATILVGELKVDDLDFLAMGMAAGDTGGILLGTCTISCPNCDDVRTRLHPRPVLCCCTDDWRTPNQAKLNLLAATQPSPSRLVPSPDGSHLIFTQGADPNPYCPRV